MFLVQTCRKKQQHVIKSMTNNINTIKAVRERLWRCCSQHNIIRVYQVEIHNNKCLPTDLASVANSYSSSKWVGHRQTLNSVTAMPVLTVDIDRKSLCSDGSCSLTNCNLSFFSYRYTSPWPAMTKILCSSSI